MKKILLIIVLITIAHIETKAQQLQLNSTATIHANLRTTALSETNPGSMYLPVTNDQKKDYDYYMRKRKNQKTIGWSLLGGGFLLGGVGLLLANSESNRNSYDHSSGKAAGVCVVASAAAGIASIPFMIMATSNKQKAKLALSSQQTGFGLPVKNQRVTGFSMSIPLGK